nr:hypothetical protein [Candidatus Omnitrophota bacterium]
MKVAVTLTIFFIFMTCLKIPCFADEIWEPVTGINETDLNHIAIDASNNNIIYTASEKAIYRPQNNGNIWTIVFSTSAEDNVINFITVNKGDIFVCTKNGLFRSDNNCLDWKKIFKGIGDKENNVAHIAFSKDKKIYIATDSGLFISSDNGVTWSKDFLEVAGYGVRWVEFLDDIIFIATEKGVYKNSGSGWRRTFTTTREDTEYDADITDESLRAAKPVNSISINKDIVFLATDSGIFVSEDKGEIWKSFINAGLISLKIKKLICKDNFYAATNKGVFMFSEQEKLWKQLYKGMATKDTRDIAVNEDGYLWAATKKGLYKTKLLNIDDKGYNLDEILESFNNEPSIRDVQKATVEYAEVNPDKIKAWRNSANKKALLPNVSVGLDRYVTDYWHWDSGTNPDTLQKGKDAVGWDVKMTWDMGELIWNNDQTSIDTRSKLMVELRDDIMNEVTRTYFERRRLQIEILASPPQNLKLSLEKELRLQELTADIDALTGGYFSKCLEK